MSRWRKAQQQWVLRHTPRQLQAQLTQRRIYLLPTRFGVTLLLVALAVWIGALNYAVSLAYVLAFWLLALVLLSVLLAYRQLAGLQLRPLPAANVFAGDDARFDLQLQWADAAPRRLHLGWYHTKSDSVCCQQPGDYTLSCPAPHRGVLALPMLRLWSEAPFGLIRAFAHVRLQAELWVYPQPLPDPRPLPAQDGTAAGDAQQTEADEFAGLTAWHSGQNTRHIAWRVYARRGVLAAREWQGAAAGGGQACLDWDDYPPAVLPEQRLAHLCWQLLAARDAGCSVQLRLPTAVYTLSPAQYEAGLLALAQFGVHDGR